MIERIGYKPMSWGHVTNVKFSMLTSLYATEEYAKSTDPNIRNAWSNMDNRMKEAQWVARVTQFWYDVMGLAVLYRGNLGKIIFKLQSFGLSFINEFGAEMVHRAAYGRPTWMGSEGPAVLPTSSRIGALRFAFTGVLVAGLLEQLGLDYSKAFWGGVGLSPQGAFFAALVKKLSRNPRERKEADNMFKRMFMVFVPLGLPLQRLYNILIGGSAPWYSLFTYPSRETYKKYKQEAEAKEKESTWGKKKGT